MYQLILFDFLFHLGESTAGGDYFREDIFKIANEKGCGLLFIVMNEYQFLIDDKCTVTF